MFKERFKKGVYLEENMLTLKKPDNEIQEKDIKKVFGKKLIKDVNSNRLLKIEDINFN